MTDRKILLTTGYETDQNNTLVEMVIPSTVETLNAPTKVTFMGETLNYIPSTITALQEFDAPNITSVATNVLKGYTALRSVKFSRLTSITNTGQYSGMLYGCSALVNVDMPALESIFLSGYPMGVFYSCSSLTSVNLPSLKYITHSTNATYGGTFMNCTNLAKVNLPKLQTLIDTISGNAGYGSTFTGCTSLSEVTFGSIGNPVTRISNSPFSGCSQSGLTITIYTQGGAALSGAPWGATNATIVYEEA